MNAAAEMVSTEGEVLMRSISVKIFMLARASVEFNAIIPVPDDLDLGDEKAVANHVENYERENNLLGEERITQRHLDEIEFDGCTVHRVIEDGPDE